ncbi:hypothetical protein ACX818_001369 [Acinetobacter baumannii]
MSIIFAFFVFLFIAFSPIMMVVWYRAGTGVAVATVFLNLLAFFTAGIAWIFAFVLAAIGIGPVKSLKTVGFIAILLILSYIFCLAEISYVINLIGAK